MTQVSEVRALKIENYSLKLASLQQMAQQLRSEQSALIEQARAEVGAPGGHLLNTETRLFVAPNSPQPLSTSKVRQIKRAKAG